MSYHIIPLFRSPFGWFDRQRYLFPSWRDQFEDDWRALDLLNAMVRFDKELETVRQDLHQLDDRHAPTDQSKLDVDSPFVTDAEGNRKLSLRFDVSKFNPEELTVKTKENVLTVDAKHTEESPGRKVHREFHREFVLPKNVDPKTLKSVLSKDGVLQIEAPAPPAVEAPKENLVPIERHEDGEQATDSQMQQ